MKTSPRTRFLHSPGDMAERIRTHEWSSTPLGPIDAWPQSLMTTVELMLASRFPMFTAWGPELTFLYNDAYVDVLAGKHPRAVGRPFQDIWSEIWTDVEPMIDAAMGGQASYFENLPLVMNRQGYDEQTWFTFSYSPVRDDDGTVAGMFCACVETTGPFMAERRQQVLLDLNDAVRDLIDPAEIAHASSRILAEALNVSRVGYGVMDTTAETVTIERDWNAPGVHSLAGVIRFRDFGDYIEDLARGEVVVFSDAARDPRVGDGGLALAGIRATALINLPLIEQGKVVALLFVNNAEPRIWSDGEVALVREVAERVRTAAERARATVALRDSEGRYRALFEAIDEGFCIIEFIDGPEGPLSDYIHVQANAAYTENAGIPDVVGRKVRQMVGSEAQEWIDLYKGVLDTGKPIRFEKELVETGRWLELAAFRVEPADRNQVAVLFKDLTERRRAELAVRESEARFRNMADNTPMMMWVTDPNGYCTYLNKTWYEFTGQSKAEAEGFGWLDATHPDDKARAEKAFLDANAAHGPFRVEYRVRRADGVYRWAIDAASPRFDANGDYLGYVGSVVDIDERREIEDALRASETELRQLNAELEERVIERTLARGQTWQLSPELFAVADARGYLIETNPSWQKVFGWSAEELAAIPFMDLVHPDDIAVTNAEFETLLAGEPLLRFENRYRAKDGSYRWLSWVAVPDDDLIYASARDITAAKASEAERDRLWTLSADMLARADYGGGMSAVNPAWTQVLGWSEHELLTNPYADIINPADVPATVAALTQMGETGKPTRFQNSVLSKDGRWTPIDWTVAPEPDGVNFIAVGRDLTEDKAREAELQAAQEALRQSQKMEAVGQLTGGIAHDFNNLLAGISGSLELLGKRLAEGRLNGMDRYITAAQGSAQRAAALTQRLLAFSRRQTLDPTPADVNRLISGMEDLIRRTVGPDVELEVVGAAGLWTTRVDQPQLENALLNLCINARDAMAPGGGRLTIETANKWMDERAAGARDLTPGQYISLCVTDTGSGMTPEVQAQAFDPFFTTKPLGQGTGLGLSMIHGFVRQSGGQVRIYSEVGKGTTMCLYLPRWLGDAEVADDTADTPVADGGHGETVLVIDDEETVRMLVVEVLSDAGYRVIDAPDGPSGLEILRSDARIDLLVTDVGLPGGLNGRQVADAARGTRPDLKVLFITGYAENAAVGNGLLDAGMAVITKPFVMSELAIKVHDMIEG